MNKGKSGAPGRWLRHRDHFSPCRYPLARTALALVLAGLLVPRPLEGVGAGRHRIAAAPPVARVDPAAAAPFLQLVRQVGALQGRLQVLEMQADRLVRATGLEATGLADQALGATGQLAHPAVSASATRAAPGTGLRRVRADLEALRRQLDAQAGLLSMIDAVWADQAAAQARLPTRAPVESARLSSPYGWRHRPLGGGHTLHQGLDLAAPHGTAIRAASGGVVVQARTRGGYGKMVELDHGNGLRTRYAHASRLEVAPGAIVRPGQPIARVGRTGRATGPHLHFEVRLGDYSLDPTPFLVRAQSAGRASGRTMPDTLAPP